MRKKNSPGGCRCCIRPLRSLSFGVVQPCATSSGRGFIPYLVTSLVGPTGRQLMPSPFGSYNGAGDGPGTYTYTIAGDNRTGNYQFADPVSGSFAVPPDAQTWGASAAGPDLLAYRQSFVFDIDGNFGTGASAGTKWGSWTMSGGIVASGYWDVRDTTSQGVTKAGGSIWVTNPLSTKAVTVAVEVGDYVEMFKHQCAAFRWNYCLGTAIDSMGPGTFDPGNPGNFDVSTRYCGNGGPYAGNTQDPQQPAVVAMMAPRSFAAPAPSPALRVGLVAPCLMMGGAESWQLALADAVGATLGDLVEFAGAAIVDPGRIDPGALADLSDLMPVEVGIDAVRDLAARVDVVATWAVLDYPALFEGLASPPRTLFVAHLPTPWSDSSAAMLAGVDRFVAVSDSALAAIPPDLAARAEVIPNAVDAGRLESTRGRAEVRASWGVPAGDRVIGFLGRLAPEKDPLACARLARSLPPGYSVVVVGGGPLAADLAADAPPNLRIVGPDRDRGGALAGFDRLIVPSRFESFGLQMAEAAWSGVPILSTPVGLAGENPGLARPIPIDADGPTLAAAALADLADPADAARRAEAARATVRRRFGPERFGRAYARALAGLAPAGLGAAIRLAVARRDPEILAAVDACEFGQSGYCGCDGRPRTCTRSGTPAAVNRATDCFACKLAA